MKRWTHGGSSIELSLQSPRLALQLGLQSLLIAGLLQPKSFNLGLVRFPQLLDGRLGLAAEGLKLFVVE